MLKVRFDPMHIVRHEASSAAGVPVKVWRDTWSKPQLYASNIAGCFLKIVRQYSPHNLKQAEELVGIILRALLLHNKEPQTHADEEARRQEVKENTEMRRDYQNAMRKSKARNPSLPGFW